MKSFAFIVLVAQVALLQSVCSSQIIARSPCGCGSNIISAPIISSALLAGPSCAPQVYNPAPILSASPVIPNIYSAAPLVVQPTDLAGSLADTLSLLTVSSLLAEKLPFNAPVISVPVSTPYIGGCACGGNNFAGYYL